MFLKALKRERERRALNLPNICNSLISVCLKLSIGYSVQAWNYTKTLNYLSLDYYRYMYFPASQLGKYSLYDNELDIGDLLLNRKHGLVV